MGGVRQGQAAFAAALTKEVQGAGGAGGVGGGARAASGYTHDWLSVVQNLEEAHVVVPDGSLPVRSFYGDPEDTVNDPKEAVENARERKVRPEDLIIHGVLLLLQPLSPVARVSAGSSVSERGAQRQAPGQTTACTTAQLREKSCSSGAHVVHIC